MSRGVSSLWRLIPAAFLCTSQCFKRCEAQALHPAQCQFILVYNTEYWASKGKTSSSPRWALIPWWQLLVFPKSQKCNISGFVIKNFLLTHPSHLYCFLLPTHFSAHLKSVQNLSQPSSVWDLIYFMDILKHTWTQPMYVTSFTCLSSMLVIEFL